MNDLYSLYRQAGSFRKSLAEYVGVSERTVKNWEIKNNAPVAVVKLIQFVSDDLSHLDADWAGFYFNNAELYWVSNNIE